MLAVWDKSQVESVMRPDPLNGLSGSGLWARRLASSLLSCILKN
jgi:hypothetical protein